MCEARLAIWRRAGFVFLQLGVVAVPVTPFGQESRPTG